MSMFCFLIQEEYIVIRKNAEQTDCVDNGDL